MGQISVDLTDDRKSDDVQVEARKLKDLARGLPSAGKAKSETLRHATRTTWAFSNVPLPIKQKATERASQLDMGLKQFFYHCLRLGGVDIPEDETIDGRRR